MRRALHVLRLGARTLGELLITAGVVILLFVAYELWITNLYTNREQTHLRQAIEAQWHHPVPVVRQQHATLVDPPLGDGLAILRIPRLGRSYLKVIVEGVDHEDLKRGPGHYPGTALPGQIGNFVVSGHRTTYGEPFNRLAELRLGDAIVIETRADFYTYDVSSIEIVDPTDMAVIAPVPDQPGAVPKVAMLTFTTCNPEYSARQRLVVHGRLVNAVAKSTGLLPPALGG
ncbi:MAG TPA: class E sortase [Mycobacteriales bacterium]|nr:class E sortase [Mycobacteriales bacterium]